MHGTRMAHASHVHRPAAQRVHARAAQVGCPPEDAPPHGGKARAPSRGTSSRGPSPAPGNPARGGSRVRGRAAGGKARGRGVAWPGGRNRKRGREVRMIG